MRRFYAVLAYLENQINPLIKALLQAATMLQCNISEFVTMGQCINATIFPSIIELRGEMHCTVEFFPKL